MVVVAQLVRASVCGTEGRRFEPGLPPKKQTSPVLLRRDFLMYLILEEDKKTLACIGQGFFMQSIIFYLDVLSTITRSLLLATSQAV